MNLDLTSDATGVPEFPESDVNHSAFPEDAFTLAQAKSLLLQVANHLVAVEDLMLAARDDDPNGAAVLRLGLEACRGIFIVINIIDALEEDDV